MKEQINEITVKKNGDEEIYFEPERLSSEDLNTLKAAGWKVRQRKIDVADSIRKLRAKADKYSATSAKLAGASSISHAYSLGEGMIEERITKINNAANGRGSLVD